MTSCQLTKVDATTVHIEAVVSAEEVDAAFETAQKDVDLLKQRPLGEKQLGDDPERAVREAVATRATRAITEKASKQAVEENGLRLTQNPKVNIDKVAERGKEFAFSFNADVVPECTLRDYADLTVRISAASDVTDDEVDAKLEEIRQRSADLSRHSKEPLDGIDIAKISFTSTIDGEGYEGDTADGYAYQLGSGHLPEGFEDGLRGMKAGETKTIEFVIPQDFDNADIAGKTACFKVTVEDATRVTLPDIDDEFARQFKYTDLAEFRQVLRKRVAMEHEGEHDAEKEREARRALADLLVEDIPETLLNAQAHRMLEAFKTELLQQNIQFTEYCGFLGLTESQVVEEMKEEASHTLRENLALESLFRDQGFKVTKDDLQKTADDVALDNGLSLNMPFEGLSAEQQQAIREMTEHRLATEWLMEHATFVEE